MFNAIDGGINSPKSNKDENNKIILYNENKINYP